MFTGIVLAVGKIQSIQPQGGDCRLRIDSGTLDLGGCALGDSIAVNGVCLTAVELQRHSFTADVSNETLSRTLFKYAKVGTPVNLELAMTPSSRLGGHIVSGHVDGIGQVLRKFHDGRSVRFEFKAPDSLAKYIAEKGSICINGISLTVNEVKGAQFAVNIVPHTLQMTTLGTTEIGDQVNLEVDLLARYLERLMHGDKEVHAHGVSEQLLLQSGFIR